MFQPNTRTLIANYHRLYAVSGAAAPVNTSADFYSLSADHFRRHLEYLKRSGFRTLLLDEFLAAESLPDSRTVILTFDDGHASDLSIAAPLLAEFGFRAVFFVCVEYIGSPGYLGWERIRQLMAAGMSVQCHGLLHRDLTQLTAVEASDELAAARHCLEHNLGTEIRYLALPGGFMDERVRTAALQAGFQAICTSVPGLAQPGRYLKRVAIRHSTTQAEFQALVDRRSLKIFKSYATYRAASGLKRMIGVGHYEALKLRLWP